MNSKAQLTVDIITKVAEQKLTICNAAKLLNKSKRTIERHLQQYCLIGIQFVIHKNCGKTPINKISDLTKSKVQRLIKTKYFDLNLTHLMEMLSEKENIHIKNAGLKLEKT